MAEWLPTLPACRQACLPTGRHLASGFGRENYRQFVGSDLRLSAFGTFVLFAA
jgi:hypothetical protein